MKVCFFFAFLCLIFQTAAKLLGHPSSVVWPDYINKGELLGISFGLGGAKKKSPMNQESWEPLNSV